MNFIAVRFVLWLFTLAAFPVPVTLISLSFRLEVLEHINLHALPPGAHDVEWTERIQVYLEKAEKKEIDPPYLLGNCALHCPRYGDHEQETIDRRPPSHACRLCRLGLIGCFNTRSSAR
jgi:hypothetical protein